MTAQLFNIGTPRALGLVYGCRGWGARSPYQIGSPAFHEFEDGFWNGWAEHGLSPPVVQPSRLPGQKFDPRS